MKQSVSKWITISEDDQVTSQVKKVGMLKRAKQWLNGQIKTEKIPQEDTVLNLEQKINEEEDQVKHRWFWASGLIAVMVFAALLLVPKDRLSALIPANLFDILEEAPVIDLIPPQPGSEAYSAEEEAAAEEQNAFNGNQGDGGSLVQAQDEAKNVLVDPIYVEVDPVSTEVEESVEADPEATEEAVDLDPAAPVDVETEIVESEAQKQVSEALAEQQKLIEELTQQLDAFQKKSDDQAEQLAGQQNIPLHPAAGNPNAGLQISQILGQQPGITATQLPQGTSTLPIATTPSPTITTSLPVAQPTTTYRLNPYQVTQSPAQILAANQAKLAAGQQIGDNNQTTKAFAQAQANAAAANAQLEHVQGTPESGPMNLPWIALAFGLFVGLRTLRKRV